MAVTQLQRILYSPCRLACAALLLLACGARAAIDADDVALERAFPNLLFSSPTVIAAPPGDSARFYVATRSGVVHVFDNDDAVTSASTFLDISDRVSEAGGEEGLLGLALDPDFALNGRLFVNYVTRAAPRRTIVSRFRLNSDGLSADPDSERVLLEFAQPYANHNGGWIGFGPDRQLYVATGDGGSGGDPLNNAQRLDTLLGKVLRIRRDGSIPADNPFVGSAGARAEIWAYGLRNPYRMGFDSVSGRLWAGDVGQNAWEEIDLVSRGGNYGWRVYEGNHDYDNPQGLPPSAFVAPVHEYPHSDGCSVIGGTVYRGTAIPALQGLYVYSDYCSATLWALSGTEAGATVNTAIGTVPGNPGSFGEDANGELYLTTLNGRIYRLVPGTGSSPGAFAPRLSGTGLFADTAALEPAANLQAYAINAAFWSDRARKQRWFRLPAGGRIGFTPLGAWKFPVGSVTVKHFDITLADGTTRRLETRVLKRTREGWRGASYRWNAAQTDASLVTNTERETLQVPGPDGTPRTQSWEYPGQSACLRCHTEAAGFVLGLSTPQLNRRALDTAQNQLLAFEQAGLFGTDIADPGSYARLPNPLGTAPSLPERARAYLHVNCSQCHRPGGPTNVDMDLRWLTPVARMRTHGVAPTGGDLGIAGARRIDPGSRETSLVWQRIRRLDNKRMPPLGSHVVHGAGVALLGEWIDAGAP